jgi:hypothetical protein
VNSASLGLWLRAAQWSAEKDFSISRIYTNTYYRHSVVCVAERNTILFF